jgi:hypothetical protein
MKSPISTVLKPRSVTLLASLLALAAGPAALAGEDTGKASIFQGAEKKHEARVAEGSGTKGECDRDPHLPKCRLLSSMIVQKREPLFRGKDAHFVSVTVKHGDEAADVYAALGAAATRYCQKLVKTFRVSKIVRHDASNGGEFVIAQFDCLGQFLWISGYSRNAAGEPSAEEKMLANADAQCASKVAGVFASRIFEGAPLYKQGNYAASVEIDCENENGLQSPELPLGQ